MSSLPINFSSLQPTPDSLNRAAEYALLNPNGILQSWFRAFEEADKPTTRLTLIYFCNEVLQMARRQEASSNNTMSHEKFINEFVPMLPQCFKKLKEQKPEFEPKLKRVVEVWTERATLSRAQLETITNELQWNLFSTSDDDNNNSSSSLTATTTTTTTTENSSDRQQIKRPRNSVQMEDPKFTKHLRELDEVAKSLGVLDASEIEPSPLYTTVIHGIKQLNENVVEDYLLRKRHETICKRLFRVIKVLKNEKPNLTSAFHALRSTEPAEEYESKEAQAREANRDQFDVVSVLTPVEISLAEAININDEVNDKCSDDQEKFTRISEMISQLIKFENSIEVGNVGEDVVVDDNGNISNTIMFETELRNIDRCIEALEDAQTKIKEGSVRLAVKADDELISSTSQRTHSGNIGGFNNAPPKTLPPLGGGSGSSSTQRQPWQAPAPLVGGTSTAPWLAASAMYRTQPTATTNSTSSISSNAPVTTYQPAWMGYQNTNNSVITSNRPVSSFVNNNNNTTNINNMVTGAVRPVQPIPSFAFNTQQPPMQSSQYMQFGQQQPRPVQPIPFTNQAQYNQQQPQYNQQQPQQYRGYNNQQRPPR
jgi:hypothetical protein